MLSVNEAVAAYVAAHEARNSSPRTVESVRLRLARFADNREDCALTDITAEDIDDHFQELHDAGLAIGTLAGQKATLRAFFKFCASHGWIKADPTIVLAARRHSYSYRPVHSRAAPRDDFLAVVQALPEFAAHRNYNARDVRDAALVAVAVDSSARRGEIHKMRVKDVKRALAAGQPLEGGRTAYHVLSHGKTGAATVRWYDETAALLSRWLTLIPEDARYVWCNLRNGKRLRADALRLGLERVCAFAGVERFGWHAIRKRNVTDMIRTTGDAKMGQLYAGHADERTTQTYYNDLDDAMVDEAAAHLADLRHGPHAGGLADALFKRAKR